MSIEPTKPVTVAELIKYLKKQQQDLPVLYRSCSEQVMLELADIGVQNLCEARPDGWVQDARPDRPTVPYLVFPGN